MLDDRPELAQGLYEVAAEATLDIPGEEENDVGSLEEWLERHEAIHGQLEHLVEIAVVQRAVPGDVQLVAAHQGCHRRPVERAFGQFERQRRQQRLEQQEAEQPAAEEPPPPEPQSFK